MRTLRQWLPALFAAAVIGLVIAGIRYQGIAHRADDRPVIARSIGVSPDFDTEEDADAAGQNPPAPIVPPVMSVPDGAAKAEQTTMGAKAGITIAASFDGLGFGFTGPQGANARGNPSDNSLAAGPDHIVQIVNGGMAIFTKKGKKYSETGKPLYGPVSANTLFKGQGGQCEVRNSGDAVVRYDQLADRWLFVLPLFQRGPVRPDQPAIPKGGDPATLSVPAVAGQPGAAAPLFVPPPPPPPDPNAAPPARRGGQPPAGGRGQTPQGPQGPFGMCYAISTSSDPMGSYYRYEFLRPLFPDYPRPAIWNDGYYVPTSTGDNRISETVATQKHACVVERGKMLKGEPAREQCLIVENVNFLNNADIDGKAMPPQGAPNIMLAAGAEQLSKKFEDDGIYAWQFYVDWKDPSKTHVTGPAKIAVTPYHYLCDGQLTNCVPQPDVERRLDAQGDKLMARVAYRRVNGKESIVAVHSVNTSAGGGGVRWYEFNVDTKTRAVSLKQHGTYAPEGLFRWMGSPAIDKFGNIGIGYSFGGLPNFAGQRFAGRLAKDPLNQLTLKEAVLVAGEAAQTNTLRWEDYTQTGVDPSDDCTIWYVGDYVKKDAKSYSTRIGAFRMPGCTGK
jgi:hypothetical protein